MSSTLGVNASSVPRLSALRRFLTATIWYARWTMSMMSLLLRPMWPPKPVPLPSPRPRFRTFKEWNPSWRPSKIPRLDSFTFVRTNQPMGWPMLNCISDHIGTFGLATTFGTRWKNSLASGKRFALNVLVRVVCLNIFLTIFPYF